LLFAVASMLATGLSLTAAQILQPLKDASPVILVLLANCVLVRFARLPKQPGPAT
jgi:predicted Na+-dependent transporter